MKLRWSVRSSFLDYVEQAHGTVRLADGAEKEDGVFTFPGSATAPGTWEFTGTVGFEAHGGMLSVALVDPTLTIDDGEGSLTVATKTADDAPRHRIARVVDIEQTGGVLSGQVRLTVAGSRLFGDVYRPGDLMDPLEVRGLDA